MVTAQAVGRAMSTLVVQECYFCLCLADMKEVDKKYLLNAPITLTSHFGDAAESIIRQLSAALEQTGAITPRQSLNASLRRHLGLLLAEGVLLWHFSFLHRLSGSSRNPPYKQFTPAQPAMRWKTKPSGLGGRPGEGGINLGDGKNESMVFFIFCSSGSFYRYSQNHKKGEFLFLLQVFKGALELWTGAKPCVLTLLPRQRVSQRQSLLQQDLPSSATHQRKQVSVTMHDTSVGALTECGSAITSAPHAAGTLIVPLIHLVRCHCTQEKRRVATNPGPAFAEPSTSQVAIQTADAQEHTPMHSSKRPIHSHQPFGRMH